MHPYCFINLYLISCITGDKGHQWVQLQADTHFTQSQCYAQGTSLNIKSHWRSYFIFCKYFGITPLPANGPTLCMFLQFMSRTINSFKYLCNVMSSIKKLHQCTGYQLIAGESLIVKAQLSGLRRILGDIQIQKLPVTPGMLLHIYQLLNTSDTFHLCLWAAFTFGFFTFLRKSNIAAPSLKDFNPDKHLTRGDIFVSQDMLLVKVRWSKTIQFKQRLLLLPVSAIPNSVLCPVKAYSQLAIAVPACHNSPAFQYLDGAGRVTPLTHTVLVNSLKLILSTLGYNPQLYAGHSLRRGGATFAFQAGADHDLIRLQGDWASNAYQRYLQVNFSDKISTTRLMASQLTLE